MQFVISNLLSLRQILTVNFTKNIDTCAFHKTCILRGILSNFENMHISLQRPCILISAAENFIILISGGEH